MIEEMDQQQHLSALKAETDRLNAEAWELRATDMRKAYRVAKEALDHAIASDHQQGIAESKRTLAISGLSMGLHAEAYEHAMAASRMFRDSGDMRNEAMVLNTLGAIYDYLNDYENRLQANLRSLELRKLSGDHEGLLRSMNNTGDTYTRMGEYDKALALFEDCLTLLDDSRPSMKAIVLSNIGEVYLFQGRDIEAAAKLTDSLEIAKRVNYTGIILADLIMLARLANKAGNHRESISLLQDSLNHIDENTGRNELAEIHLGLSQAWQALGDAQKALEQHHLFYRYQEQHLNEKKIKEIRGMQFRQEISELQTQTAELERLVQERTRQVESTLAELQKKEAATRQILENALDAVVGMDSKGHITRWNRRAEEIFGWKVDEVIGRPLGDTIVPPHHRQGHENGFSRFVHTRESHMMDTRIEIEALHRSGRVFPVELAITAIDDGQGPTFNAFINDISERKQIERERQQDLEVEKAVNQFSQTLFLQNTVDEVLWDLAKNCISRLGFEDCVIYTLAENGNDLIQKAAYGPKNPIDLDIFNPIIIPLGQGIVGSVAQSGAYELVNDTSADERYIIDDQMRYAEIAVPIISSGKVIGVIDSEHGQKGFFTEKHLRVLQTIASLVANRIDRIKAQEQREQLQLQLISQLRKNEQLQTQVTRELEQKVKERTSEIEAASLRIETQAKDIRDSINYARSIQNALLPTAFEVRNHFADSFILYLPRDVVSGDFYWVASKGSKRYLAVADCTGHGVPGALVSVLGVEKLERALLLADNPAEILKIVNNEMKRSLRQSQVGNLSMSRDGMDVALICHDTATNELYFAGAKRPIWHIRNGELTVLSPTRLSIGGHSPIDQPFEEQQLTLNSGDQIYLFTDGYADQFGGPQGRKLTTGRLRESVLSHSTVPMPRQHRNLLASLHYWQGREEQVDDVLIIGIKF